jgi:hypothetical protein
MATTKPARPVKQPARATGVSKTKTAKTKTAKTTAKKSPKKAVKAAKAGTKKPKSVKTKPAKVSKQAFKQCCAKVRASVEKRKATVDKTLLRGDPTAIVDPGDHAGRTLLAARAEAAEPIAKIDIDPLDAEPSVRRKRSAVDRVNDPPPASGVVLIERVVDAIERELTKIEQIVNDRPKRGMRTETERRARTLASLARTLAEVKRLRAEQPRRPEDDDAIPRDLDELRRTLSRRLEQMVEPPAELSAAGDE